MIGTTHFTNAVLERKGLLPVGVLRLALPSTAAIPPFTDWPDDLSALVRGGSWLVRGGYQYTGELADPLDEQGLVRALREMKASGIRSVALTGPFAPVNDTMETHAAEIVRNELPDAHLTLSSTIGRLGLLERENASILNASLVDLSRRVVDSFRAQPPCREPGSRPGLRQLFRIRPLLSMCHRQRSEFPGQTIHLKRSSKPYLRHRGHAP